MVFVGFVLLVGIWMFGFFVGSRFDCCFGFSFPPTGIFVFFEERYGFWIKRLCILMIGWRMCGNGFVLFVPPHHLRVSVALLIPLNLSAVNAGLTIFNGGVCDGRICGCNAFCVKSLLLVVTVAWVSIFNYFW